MTGRRLPDLDPAARDLAARSTGWMDGYWDDEVGLLWHIGEAPLRLLDPAAPARVHTTRNTAWYAAGLLLRDGPGDRERAARALMAVLRHQFDEPGRVYHGTFYRAPEEPHPPAEPREWRDYDPNWREFVGTTLALILREYEPELPADLVRGMDGALRRAVAGTLARRVRASYTNIALMAAFLLDYAADRFGVPDWAREGEALARGIHDLFRVHDTFNEYNSPTYYGVDLYALALWRSHALSPALRELGADMEARLWTDIARFYHAGLRNVAGPYDRSYGMDLRRYASLLGMWIWLAVGRTLAPFPDPSGPFDHPNDFCFAPPFALLGARVPDGARPHLLAFRGERAVERPIEPAQGRVATAWLGREVMFGAEATVAPARGWVQFHPATIHWRIAPDEVGWIRLLWLRDLPLAAHAEEGRLSLACDAAGPERADLDFVFRAHAPGAGPEDIEHDRWRLPGLTVRVETAVDGPDVGWQDEQLEVRYTARRGGPGDSARIVLRVEGV